MTKPTRFLWSLTLTALDEKTATFGRNPTEASASIARDDWQAAGEPHVLYLTNERPERETDG